MGRHLGGEYRPNPRLRERGGEQQALRSTRWMPLIIFSLIMLAISLILLRWARKQGWW
jgi:hypothetical protein